MTVDADINQGTFEELEREQKLFLASLFLEESDLKRLFKGKDAINVLLEFYKVDIPKSTSEKKAVETILEARKEILK